MQTDDLKFSQRRCVLAINVAQVAAQTYTYEGMFLRFYVNILRKTVFRASFQKIFVQSLLNINIRKSRCKKIHSNPQVYFQIRGSILFKKLNNLQNTLF